MKKLIIAALTMVIFAAPAMAKSKASKKPAKEQNSLIGEQKLSKSISVGNDYEPSQYPKSGYSLGNDGLYHFNPARVGGKH